MIHRCGVADKGLPSYSGFPAGGCRSGGSSVSSCGWRAAELGRQELLIHVDTPKRGKIHVCRAIHSITKPSARMISILADPRSCDMFLRFPFHGRRTTTVQDRIFLMVAASLPTSPSLPLPARQMRVVFSSPLLL